jgi:pimeloyl-ACP methyl ester carboxylesterase
MNGSSSVRRRVVEVDGIRAPLVEAGPPDADEAVVFVHGNPGSSEDWARLISHVGHFARAVAVDQPGFGQADKPPTFEHTYEAHAAHLGRTLEVLGIRRAHIVGHDLGGRWCLEWAANHPTQVGSAVIVAGGVLLDYRWHYLARIWKRRWLGEAFMATGTRGVFRMILSRGNPQGLPRAFVDRMYDDMDAGTKRAILALYRPTSDWNARSYDLADTLQRVLRTPALIVWGWHDSYIPYAQAFRQRASLPDAQIEILDRSGHWPFVDDPEAMEAVVLPFLREHVAGHIRQPVAPAD